jgi:HAD superfamily phosphatase (TIGR01668 family)
MALFYPTLYRRRITDITAEDLRAFGAKGILLDVDNTLTTHDNPVLEASVRVWLDAMQREGFSLTIVSNNRDERVRPFAEAIGLSYCARAAKPLPRGYRAAARAMGLKPCQCVAIGDQIFTDILGANVAGMSSVLLEPIEPEVEQKFIVFKRQIERVLLSARRAKCRREEDYRAK